MKKRFGVLFVFVLLLSACSVQQKGFDLNPAQEVVILFENTGPWDMKIRKLMENKIREIEVPFNYKVTAAEYPELMNKWLTAVYDNKGTIEHIRPDAIATRGILQDVVNYGIVITRDYIKKRWEVKAAKYYNAEIYYGQRGEYEVINKVVFKRKPR